MAKSTIGKDTKTITAYKNRKKRILVIDDDKDTSSSSKIVLEESGLFKVDAFDDPIRELATFKPNGYDVLVLDVKMRDIDGFKEYRKLKTIDEKIKICSQHLSTTLITTGCIQR